MSLYLILAYPHTCLWCKCQFKIVGFLSYKNVGKPTRLYDVLFAIAICCNYRFNLLHKCIIVILIVNSSKHWVSYNIAISIDKYGCRKSHNIRGLFTRIGSRVKGNIAVLCTLAFKNGGSFLHGSFIAVEGFRIDADDFAAHCFERIV